STLIERVATSPVPLRPASTAVIDVDLQQSLGAQVGLEARRWHGRRRALGTLDETISGPDDALTRFMRIVLLSIQGRRLTKRYLRRGALHRFDIQVALEGITMHGVYDSLFRTCLRTMLRSWVTHRNLTQALGEAWQAIQRLAVNYPLVVQFPHFMDHPYE